MEKKKKKSVLNSHTTALWKNFVLFTGSVLELLFEKLECLSEKILDIVKLLKFYFVNWNDMKYDIK